MGIKNEIKTIGDTTIIYLKRKNGDVFESLVDTEDLPKINEINGTWYAMTRDEKNFYTCMTKSKSKGLKMLSLHRIVMNAQKGEYVDHINHNTLDNRKKNMRICTNAENGQNLSGARSDNKSSGLRGVSFRKDISKWRAYINLDGKFIHLGYFDSKDEANEVVKKARREQMPFSQEAL